MMVNHTENLIIECQKVVQISFADAVDPGQRARSDAVEQVGKVEQTRGWMHLGQRAANPDVAPLQVMAVRSRYPIFLSQPIIISELDPLNDEKQT